MRGRGCVQAGPLSACPGQKIVACLGQAGCVDFPRPRVHQRVLRCPSASQIDLQFPAGPGVDFSRAYGTQKCALVPEGRIGGAAWQSALACSPSSLHRPCIQTERHVPVRDVVMLLLHTGRPRTLEHASRTAPLVAILSNSSHTASRAGGDNLSRVSMASWTYVRTARASCVCCEPTASTMAAFFYGMSWSTPSAAQSLWATPVRSRAPTIWSGQWSAWRSWRTRICVRWSCS